MMNANESKGAAPVGGHTPGPWFVSVCVQGESCWCRCISTKPDSDDMDDCVIPSGAVNVANARLIAAAPDLLAELEREYETLADIRNEWPGRNTSKGQAKLCRLRDLIAKATGRTERDVQDDFSCRAALAPFQTGGAE